MGKIFCLMGKSSTGKDTIYKRLLEDQELGLRRIVPSGKVSRRELNIILSAKRHCSVWNRKAAWWNFGLMIPSAESGNILRCVMST